jgi:hypothetical protein
MGKKNRDETGKLIDIPIEDVCGPACKNNRIKNFVRRKIQSVRDR